MKILLLRVDEVNLGSLIVQVTTIICSIIMCQSSFAVSLI